MAGDAEPQHGPRVVEVQVERLGRFRRTSGTGRAYERAPAHEHIRVCAHVRARSGRRRQLAVGCTVRAMPGGVARATVPRRAAIPHAAASTATLRRGRMRLRILARFQTFRGVFPVKQSGHPGAPGGIPEGGPPPGGMPPFISIARMPWPMGEPANDTRLSTMVGLPSLPVAPLPAVDTIHFICA